MIPLGVNSDEETDVSKTQTQNSRGEWVPTPRFIWGGVRCDCGRRFWSLRGHAGRRYREHYALAHILGLQ